MLGYRILQDPEGSSWLLLSIAGGVCRSRSKRGNRGKSCNSFQRDKDDSTRDNSSNRRTKKDVVQLFDVRVLLKYSLLLFLQINIYTYSISL